MPNAPPMHSNMNSVMDRQAKEHGKLNGSSVSFGGDVFEPTMNINGESEAKQRAALVEWLNSIFPNLRLPINASEEELRLCLLDGTVLCRILNRLRPGSVTEFGGPYDSSDSRLENVKRFLEASEKLRLPKFQVSDIEKGSMKNVMDCLLMMRAKFMPNVGGYNVHSNSSPDKSVSDASHRWKRLGECFGGGDGSHGHSTLYGEERRKGSSDSKFQRALRSSVIAEPSAALLHHVGHKFHEVFQLKQGCYSDIPAAKIVEMMKSNSLDNAPTQSLLSVVNGILDESVDKNNAEIPHRVACLLRKVVQEIERRISTQAEHLRTQNNVFKAREEKYQSRIRVLEVLATGTNDETEVVMNQLQQVKTDKAKIEEKKKLEEQDLVRLVKEKEAINKEISEVKRELETARKENEQRSSLMEAKAKGIQQELEKRLKEVTHLLTESRGRIKELEAHSDPKSQRWNKKENACQSFSEFQLRALRELRFSSQSIKQDVLETRNSYLEEFHSLGIKLKALADASKNYHAVLAENRKMYNELQDLKGNIRVYCRVRPFLPGQKGKQSTVDYIGENGEIVVVNSSKQGRDGHKSFKFNKVYGPEATQADVFADTQPLIRSVLDGYNVCIFAYGQTGSGKTYTMSGPDAASEEEWGVNYRALNDLFHISESRRGIFSYEIGVQMVEIYNEQVRDLLSSDGSQKRLGILSTAQPSGLAVPDASMHPVQSTFDVLELMETGLKNRAKGATALNERSSRSHSVVTIHVRGTDQKTGASLKGSLHLVDLAGSERVDRSEVTGDRLKEAQHINKSLSALGDVIFALAQKSSHIPYRNSKLTQVLQSSLGGQAKTLMFVQLNPDANSYLETVSTLKFAERVSGVELGAARSSKEGRDVRELMEQVASLKDTIAKKDEEIERLQLLKDLKNVYNGVAGEKRGSGGGTNSLRYGSSSPTKNSVGGGTQTSPSHSPSPPPQRSLKTDIGQNLSSADAEILGFGGAELEERLSDISDGGISMGTDTDGSVESNLFPEGSTPPSSDNVDKFKSLSRIPRPPQKLAKDSSKLSSPATQGLKKSASGGNLAAKPSKRWQ